jgi:Ca-activated chloride channel family protein
MNMRFAEPYWLWVGAASVILVLALRVRAERLTARAISSLSGARLLDAATLPSRFRRWLRVALVTLAVATAFVALARPQQGMEWQTLDRKGVDVLLVVDTSKSMNADDVRPSRLERSKLAVRDLVARFPADRLGLMAFAGDAYLESPLTLDHGALLEMLDSFDTSLIAKPGSDLGHAIDRAVAALEADTGRQKLMVLLTDGEDLSGQGLEAAKRAAQAGITIHTVGVGTPAGELVPATDEQGVAIGLLRDPDGNVVRSRLDEPGLRAIAQAAHGTYRPLGADGAGLERLYTEALAPLARVEHGAQLRRVYREWFALPLALALACIVLDALLGFRPRARSAKPSHKRGQRDVPASGLGAVAAAALLMLLPASAHASPESAEKAYHAGRFEQAAREYQAEQAQRPADARLAINAGVAAYRAGQFDAAAASLEKALKLADPKLQARVLYDLGDARYRWGEGTLKDAPQKTIERWKSAIAAYEGALKLAPHDADARFNRDFVKRKLADLESTQKPPPEDPKNAQSKEPRDSKDQGAKSSKDQSSGSKSSQQQPSNGSKDQDGKQQDGKQQDGKQQDGKQQDGKQQDGKQQDGKQQDGKQQGHQNQSGKPEPANQGKADPQPDASGKPALPDQQPGSSPPDTAARPAAGAKPAPAGQEPRPGELSPAEARALLDSLRGDERQVKFVKSAPSPDDGAPQKDW